MHDKELIREILEGQFLTVYKALAKRALKLHILVAVTQQMKEEHPFITHHTESHPAGFEYTVLNIGVDAGRNMVVENGTVFIALKFSGIMHKLAIDLLDIVTIGIPGEEVSFNTNGIWVSTTDPRTTGYYAVASMTEPSEVQESKPTQSKRPVLTVVKK